MDQCTKIVSSIDFQDKLHSDIMLPVHTIIYIYCVLLKVATRMLAINWSLTHVRSSVNNAGKCVDSYPFLEWEGQVISIMCMLARYIIYF